MFSKLEFNLYMYLLWFHFFLGLNFIFLDFGYGVVFQ